MTDATNEAHLTSTTVANDSSGQNAPTGATKIPVEFAHDPVWHLDMGTDLLSRYTNTGEIVTLEVAISLLQRAVELMSDSHDKKPVLYNNLAAASEWRFERSEDIRDLRSSVTAYQSAAELTPDGHPGKARFLFNYGSSLLLLVDQTGEVSDIDRAISAYRRAADLTLDDDEEKVARLNALGLSLQRRFQRTGELGAIDDAIAWLELAVAIVDEQSSEKPVLLTNLGASLLRRFERTGSLEDLDGSISMHRFVIETTPEDPGLLSNLGFCLKYRFERLNEVKDLEEAVSLLHRAVEATAEEDPHKVERLNNLGIAYQTQFERFGRVDDLVLARSNIRRAVELTPDGRPDKSGWLSNFGGISLLYFEHTNGMDTLHEAVSALELAMSLTPDGHPDKPGRLINLGAALLRRFQCTGQLDDLQRSISLHRQAVELTPDGHSAKAGRLSNLGTMLITCYETNGNLSDLENAIVDLRRSVESTPDGQPAKRIRLKNLGGAYQRRFARIYNREDIDNSIVALDLAVKLTERGDTEEPRQLNTLANSLRHRYDYSDDIEDLERAISALRRAVQLMPDGHADKPGLLSSLGACINRRFDRTQAVGDINDALPLHRRAVELTPDSYLGKITFLNNLGGCLRDLFKFDRNRQDIVRESISVYGSAVQLTPAGHPDKPVLLLNLGSCQAYLFHETQDRADLDAAVNSLMSATTESLGIPSFRLRSAVNCVRLLSDNAHLDTANSLLLAHGRILSVLPEVVWLGHSVIRRYDESAKIGMLVNGAVSTAIGAGSLQRAVEWLETGRSLVWSQILSLRTPLDELSTHRPDLAQSLKEIQQRLQRSGYDTQTNLGLRIDKDIDFIPGIVTNVTVDQHRQLVLDYERILRDIRSTAGFEDFLLPKPLTGLIPAASSHLTLDPIVFLNVAGARCDALIVSGSDMKVVPLPELTQERAENMLSLWYSCLRECGVRLQREYRATAFVSDSEEGDNGFKRVLGYLWRWIVHPVLKELSLTEAISVPRLPHITWCPTGPLTQLPLHAAGIYDSASEAPRIFDYAVSSYTSSLSALQRCRSGVEQQLVEPKVLLVTQPNTPRPGLSPLRCVKDESACLRAILPANREHTFLEHDRATVDATLAVVDQYPWVHFACHGAQRSGDPTQSAFELYDGPLTLSALMATAADNAELAFLSACQTATGDKRIPEESAHLAAGMLAVGFKGVVATMWTIQDDDAPVIVKAYYTKLLELRRAGDVAKGETGAAYALHDAAAHLRQRVGEDKFERWVPFVHYGV